MDSDRFDSFVRVFSRVRSRRQTMRGLAILAAGALALGGREADAGKRIGGSPCTKGRQCKTGKCIGTPGEKTCSCSMRYPRCTPGTICRGGVCETCQDLQAACSDTAPCCKDLDCGPISNPGFNQCCSPMAGACSTPGDPSECCSKVLSPDSIAPVYCSPNHTCGGAGADCAVSATCESGVCCGAFGVCCAVGQQCPAGVCV